jgi:subtilisin-like proprotein convertase family protein
VGVECGTATPCLTGLACAGASINGAGVCVPGWMRGAFTSEPEQSIPDGDARGVTTSLLAFGLATVSTDVLLDLAIEHPRPEDLRVTLTNPAGTEVVIQDGQGAEIWFSRRAIRGFPGDESVNGAWQLTVADKVRGTTGIIHRFGLELTSRWD